MAQASLMDPPARARASVMDVPQQSYERDIRLDSDKQLWRFDETQEVLGLSRYQIDCLLDCGELEAVPVSVNPTTARRTHRRITKRSIEAFINRRRRMAV